MAGDGDATGVVGGDVTRAAVVNVAVDVGLGGVLAPFGGVALRRVARLSEPSERLPLGGAATILCSRFWCGRASPGGWRPRPWRASTRRRRDRRGGRGGRGAGARGRPRIIMTTTATTAITTIAATASTTAAPRARDLADHVLLGHGVAGDLPGLTVGSAVAVPPVRSENFLRSSVVSVPSSL